MEKAIYLNTEEMETSQANIDKLITTILFYSNGIYPLLFLYLLLYNSATTCYYIVVLSHT